MTQIGLNAQTYAALVGLGATISTALWGLQKTPLKLSRESAQVAIGVGDFLQNMALVNLVVFPIFHRIFQAGAPWPLRLTTSLPLVVTWLAAFLYVGGLPAQASAFEDSPIYQGFNTLIKCCNMGVLYFVVLRSQKFDPITTYSLMGLSFLSTVSTFSFDKNGIKEAMTDFFHGGT